MFLQDRSTKSWAAVWLSCWMVACGNQDLAHQTADVLGYTTPQAPHDDSLALELVAGSRLAVASLSGDDGSGVKGVRFYDVKISDYCDIVQAVDGSIRCLPGSPLCADDKCQDRSQGLYVDSSCTMPGLRVPATRLTPDGLKPAAPYVRYPICKEGSSPRSYSSDPHRCAHSGVVEIDLASASSQVCFKRVKASSTTSTSQDTNAPVPVSPSSNGSTTTNPNAYFLDDDSFSSCACSPVPEADKVFSKWSAADPGQFVQMKKSANTSGI